MPARRLVPAVTAALLAAFCAACTGPAAGGATPAGAPHHAATPGSAPASARPERTVVRNARVLDIGATAGFRAQDGVALRLRASGPQVSRTRLSSSHGYPPAHGYYVTIDVTIANTGRTSLPITPQYFAVRVAGEGRVSSYDGNSPYSGAPRQLDPTQLDPGQTISAPLTFDVRSPHGRFQFLPDGSPAIVWRY